MSSVLVFVVLVACALDLTQCRTVVLQDTSAQEIVPKVHVGSDGVSASFGGYSASAGLGGKLGDSSGAVGGLYARAGTPDGTGASAGLGGSVSPGGQAQGGLYAGAGAGASVGAGTDSGASAGASAGAGSSSISNQQGNNSHKLRPSSTFYNDIFNIPTSILGAVNRLLNGGVNAVSNIGANTGHVVGAGGQVAKPGAAVHAQAGVSTGVRTSTGLFNDIFNIPITALNAVNQLLNNNPKTGK